MTEFPGATLKPTINLRTILIIAVVLTTLSLALPGALEQLLLCAFGALIVLLAMPGDAARRRLRRRFFALLPLMFMLIVVQALFRHEGIVYLQWGGLRITSGGLDVGIASALRLLLLLLTAGMLCDYPFSYWMHALSAWKVPYTLTFLIAHTLQFVPLLAAEFELSWEALVLRGVEVRRLSWRSRLLALRTSLLPILGHTLDQVKYRAAVLELRGFRRYPQRTEITGEPLCPIDYVIQTASLLTGTLVLLFYYAF